MSDLVIEQRPKRRWKRVALMTLAGLICGLPAGFVVGRLIKQAARAHLLTWSDVLSLGIAAMMLMGGVALLIASFSRSGSAYVGDPHEVEPGRKATPAQMRYYRLQALVFVLAGGMLATPVLATFTVPPGGFDLRVATLASVGVAFALQSWLNILVWRQSDELIRRASSEGAAVSFWVLQGLLFLYAAAEKLKLAPPLNSWDAITILMGLYLLMSVIVAWRRGLN